jgi:ankyrin repeat protein
MKAMPLPARPSLEQYKKQAKELVREFRRAQSRPAEDSAADRARRNSSASAVSEPIPRVRGKHPRFASLGDAKMRATKFALADAQLVIAREHGFESWPKFAKEVEARAAASFAEVVSDPVAEFIVAACVPREGWHGSGTLERAEAILKAHPRVAKTNMYTAAILGDAAGVRRFLAEDGGNATAKDGPHGWDALTYLCFSRYLRLGRPRIAGRKERAQHAAPLQDSRDTGGFVEAAKALLDAGASANTGWYEMIDHPNPRPTFESAIYGAAGLAQHPGLTRLLLEWGADPNDEETPYHVAETRDNTVMKILVESGKLNETSLTTILLRKADWHDFEGFQWLLEHGANPNRATRWGRTAFHHAVLRDNGIETLELLLEHEADPMLIAERPDPRPMVSGPPMTAVQIAVRRGRGDLLELMERRGTRFELLGVDRLLGACAKNDSGGVRAIRENQPELVREVLAEGGKLLAGFAGVGNTEGVRQLLDLGVKVDALFEEGDPYFEVTKGSTALQVAAWRGWPETVKLLLERGADVNAADEKGRTALMLAVKACVDSHWKERRTPESVKQLLNAGAKAEGIGYPSGYGEVDRLLEEFGVPEQE